MSAPAPGDASADPARACRPQGPDAKRKGAGGPIGRSASKGSLADSGGGAEPLAVGRAVAKRKAPGGAAAGAGGAAAGDGDDQPSKRARGVSAE